MTTFPFHVALHLFYGTEEVSLFPNKEKSPGFSALGSNLTEHIQFHYYINKREPTIFDRSWLFLI